MKLKHIVRGCIVFSLLLFNAFTCNAESAKAARMVLILDASGSMWGQIEGKAKITIAKEVMNDLIDGLQQDMQVGLSAYGHRRKGDCQDIEMLIPVGPVDRKAMKAKVAAISPKGKTPLSEAVRQAAQALRYTEERATVVLISDGLETCDADPCALAAELAMSGVDFKVHVIGFDITEEEQARLRCLADKTGGLFLAAGSAQALREALTQSVAKTQEPPKPLVEEPGSATLEGPASIPVGAAFEVQWEGPNSRSDYVSIAQKGSKDHRYSDYAYTEKGNPAQLVAPGDIGDYELRYMHAHTGKVVARADIKVTPVQASVHPPESADVATEFEVTWQGPAYKPDYITIAGANDSPGRYFTYAYPRQGNPLKLRAPADPGTYEVRYILGSSTKILAKAPIIINAVEAQVFPPESANVAAEFEVRWEGPANQADYITVGKPDDRPGRYDNYAYPRDGNPIKLTAPADPGTYEVRYILAKGTKILAKAPITITPVSATVKVPASVAAEEEFAVNFEGPNYKGDYVTIVKPDAKASEYLSYYYTKGGSPGKLKAPKEPGTYEVRYIMSKGKRILGRTSVTVK